MNPRAARKAVKRFFAAVNDQNSERLREVVHLGAVFEIPDLPRTVSHTVEPIPGTEQARIRGLTRFRRFVVDLHALLPEARIVLDDLISDREHTVAHWRLEGRRGHRRRRHDPAAGELPPYRGVTVFSFSSGQIVRAQTYVAWNPAHAMDNLEYA